MNDVEPPGAAPSHVVPKRGRHRWRMVIAALAVSSVALGVAIGVSATVWPDQAGEVYGQIQGEVGKLRIQAAHEVPVAKLGVPGGARELGRCDGTFTEMLSYRTVGVPPVWAAHNKCGGDVILPLNVGDKIDIVHAGTMIRYVVEDIRLASKVGSTTKQLVGLKGDLALQSCFYGGTDVPMKFVGLVREKDGTQPESAAG